MPENNFYRNWARWYANETLRKKVDAVAYVEGKTDKVFWSKVFEQSSVKVELLAGIRGEDNEEAFGKQECLKFIPFLTQRFLICIDSDYDYIKQNQPQYSTRQFILQTYAYAIENHYLASTNDERQEFLKRYSNIIYDRFLSHIAEGGSANVFCNEVAPRAAQISCLDELQHKVYPNSKVDDSSYAGLGLTKDNTYLFIKAKILKNRLQCRDELSFAHFPMNKILEDIATIFPRK